MTGKQMISGAILVVAAAVALSAFSNRPRFHRENLGHIKVGMTEAEVETLLGVPPGDYGSGKGSRFTTLEGVLVPNSVRQATWSDDHVCFEIHFDADDRVCHCYHRK
jgi:hypothetical protein